MFAQLDRGCGRCGRENYEPAGKVDEGPTILRYCTSCVKKCAKCKNAFKLDHFWPVKDSQGFKDWSASGQNIAAMVNFMLPDDFGDVCRGCQQFPIEPKVEPPKVVAPIILPLPVADDSAEGLKAQFEELFGRTL